MTWHDMDHLINLMVLWGELYMFPSMFKPLTISEAATSGMNNFSLYLTFCFGFDSVMGFVDSLIPRFCSDYTLASYLYYEFTFIMLYNSFLT
ncbi:hypothetical protein Lalb_Chr12g0208381 [Lupinus albus]|uniref:Uncharacterized protein n=1 Tax=Lupinus albus TaxID=3870 RepID=A0A6A4PNR1_LUPAL|nr:hypothetical protein Lalb_Chr12g0208381 [Lupinus albus]